MEAEVEDEDRERLNAKSVFLLSEFMCLSETFLLFFVQCGLRRICAHYSQNKLKLVCLCCALLTPHTLSTTLTVTYLSPFPPTNLPLRCEV